MKLKQSFTLKIPEIFDKKQFKENKFNRKRIEMLKRKRKLESFYFSKSFIQTQAEQLARCTHISMKFGAKKTTTMRGTNSTQNQYKDNKQT